MESLLMGFMVLIIARCLGFWVCNSNNCFLIGFPDLLSRLVRTSHSTPLEIYKLP